MTNRKQWFLDRIGKTVFRTDTYCNCDACTREYTEGVFIDDAQIAESLSDVESHHAYHAKYLKFFDTEQERNDFEEQFQKQKQWKK